jgi:hypothetical protein
MHRLLTRGPRNAGEGMRLGNLKAKYREEYAELSAERYGEYYEQPEMFVEM